MRKIHLLIVLVIVTGMVLFSVQPALAFPPLPSSFNGTVKINGANVPIGTTVSAWIKGVRYKTAIVVNIAPNMKYLLNVPGDDSSTPSVIEGGVEGDIVVFHIGNIVADQTGIWHNGSNIQINLTGNATGPFMFTIFLPFIRR